MEIIDPSDPKIVKPKPLPAKDDMATVINPEQGDDNALVEEDYRIIGIDSVPKDRKRLVTIKLIRNAPFANGQDLTATVLGHQSNVQRLFSFNSGQMCSSVPCYVRTNGWSGD